MDERVQAVFEEVGQFQRELEGKALRQWATTATDENGQIDWQDPPEQMTFEQLISEPWRVKGFNERHSRWHVLLSSGWYYTESRDDPELGNRCDALERIDWICLA